MTLRAVSLSPDYLLFRVINRTDGGHFGNFHAQRLKTLGMLAGGIAHDFNNILTGILGHITYLKTILPAAGDHRESLNAIEDGARKASLITQQILNFSKLDTGEKPQRIDLCDLAQRMCTLLRGAISPKYDLQCRIPGYAVPCLAVESKIAQVIVNLAINARDAITGDGHIVIAVDRLTGGPELVDLFGTDELATQRYARLSVIDNGRGMTGDVLERAFEPYFTTKGSLGTGLGLATVDAIVKQLGGVIEMVSEVGSGTTVNVYLPLLEDTKQPAAEVEETRPHMLPHGDERILIVDDEYPVRNVLSLSLQHLGYDVDMASSGVEALEKFAAEDSAYDLVILDMLMPQLSGDQVFFRLKAIDPDVRVLLISGYSSEEAIRSVLAGGGKAFIQKPFTIDELSKKVRECLDGDDSEYSPELRK